MSTVLLVDDEADNLKALSRVFSQEDFRLCFAASGDEALEKVDTQHPELVILDVMMPGMDGFSACERIKARDGDAMVLMLSARSDLKDRMKGYAVLADDYMGKPYDPDELLAKAGILLRLYRAQSGLKQMNRQLEDTVARRTDELVARERLAMAGAMVKGIVHNFRGPLTVARNGLQLAGLELDRLSAKDAGTVPGVGRVKKHHAMVTEALSRTGDLVDSLLVQGGFHAGEELKSMDLNGLIKKESRFLESDLFYRHGVEVKLRLADNLPLIRGKYSDFSQVFYNLAKNACEAMAESPDKRLTISSRVAAGGVELSFSDTGPGIGDDATRLFAPFFSTKSHTGDNTKGTGLGLFISSRLLAAYHARMSAVNRAPSGTVFTIFIPLDTGV